MSDHEFVPDCQGDMTFVDIEYLSSLLADAKRYRWLCDGNGYFMEESGLCNVKDIPEKARADEEIDKAMEAE
jgi:hypothetical protein